MAVVKAGNLNVSNICRERREDQKGNVLNEKTSFFMVESCKHLHI